MKKSEARRIALIRFDRIKRLRAMNAPLWLIKSEQVNLVMTRKGMRVKGIGEFFSKTQSDLYDKHVRPLMGRDE